MDQNSRIAIIGVGDVGGTVAYNLTLNSIASELLLVDLDLSLRNSQIEDLSDAAFCTNSITQIRPATYREASQSDIVVITAAPRHTLARNVSMIREVVDAMKPFRRDTILLIVANPVDLLTSITKDISGLPPSQVIGSGTYLDTARLRGMVATRAFVSASSIDINVVGVHGQDQVVAWSSASVCGVPVSEMHELSNEKRMKLASACKTRSHEISLGKGAAPFGIGSITANICVSILLDKLDVAPVSHYQEQYQCCLSMPAVIGRQGVRHTPRLRLDEHEKAAIADSAKRLKRGVELSQEGWQ
ncbi:l-lactate dehydrogenase [Fusarium flagelliforme]|uniref:L-lactate dehydrogenase n=1 Tax=Fusarium flagelliforme TaxID=2675880 RepID=A0A395N3R8_9HYPO|nr:l-lactate dehydrogenase [Fusarium flagelliforme]